MKNRIKRTISGFYSEGNIDTTLRDFLACGRVHFDNKSDELFPWIYFNDHRYDSWVEISVFFQSLADKLKEISEEESLHSSRRWDDLSNWICWKAVSYTNNNPKMETKNILIILDNGQHQRMNYQNCEIFSWSLISNSWRTRFRNVISINKIT